MYLVRDLNNDFECFAQTKIEIEQLKANLRKAFGEDAKNSIIYEEINLEIPTLAYLKYLKEEFPNCAEYFEKIINEVKEKFLNKSLTIAVHCETEEEAKEFCRLMAFWGLSWCDGASYLKVNKWDKYKNETCYTNQGTFADIECYKDINVPIYEFSDIVKE